jgi:molecular chaperone DnaK (HSP70)
VHFIVGIDLGTTNCAVAYIARKDIKRSPPKIQYFEVPQLARPGSVEARPLLPSFLYLAGSNELSGGSASLPWNRDNTLIVGELARSLGAKVPGRLVSSAKSWLCSPSVDRTAAILPWGAPDDVKRVSPVAASACYLAHIRQAWDHHIAKGDKDKKLAAQDLVITVPASFDEAARELTVQAAREAGLPNITLLEEPQAAFYAWVAENLSDLEQALSGISRVLVCDVGGGTSDFSLIEISSAQTPDERKILGVKLTRSAVGDHLMLGGDNMDLALARYLEKKFPGHLDAHQFKALTAAARGCKEQLFAENAPEKAPVTLVGRGSGVVGGTLRSELTRDEARVHLLDGFFPVSKLTDNPQTARTGIREWGLPYAHDPGVTRHLSQFLRHHHVHAVHVTHAGEQLSAGVDAVLFNGGAMKPAAFRQRVREVMQSWFGHPVRELASPSLDLAVAAGAAYYGGVRRGSGARIGGGMGRAYYIGIETASDSGASLRKTAICLVPQGAEEGQKIELPQTFILRLSTPVVFPLFTSSIRAEDQVGVLVGEESAELAPLPPLETVLHGGRRAVKKDVTVRLQAHLTEVGTLALALQSVSDDRKWEIHLNVRSRMNPSGASPGGQVGDAAATASEPTEPAGGVDPRKLDAALALVARAFDPQSRDPLPVSILTKQLEAALSLSKEAWPAGAARRLADTLLDHAPHRGHSAEHESKWLNLIGFTLRPGFGDLADEERMKRLYNQTRNGLNFVSDPNCRIEWWVLWRRVSGGLKEDHERELFNRLLPFLTGDRDVGKRGGWPRPTKGEVPEMWRAAASLELLDPGQKKVLGNLLLQHLQDDGPSTAFYWALGRVGARQPAHAQANRAVPVELAEAWLRSLLAQNWAGNPAAVFATVSLSRKTGDHARDIGEALRGKILERLKKAGAGEHDLAAVKAVTELENADRKQIFGDAPPPALRLTGS